MKERSVAKINALCERYPALESCKGEIITACEMLCECFSGGGKLMTCGNGGSASDSQHIVGELMKGFMLPRRYDKAMRRALERVGADDVDYMMDNLQGALPSVSLVSETALCTAYSNDRAPDLALAQQVLGIGQPGDTLIAISTSGNSKNILYAADCARAKGIRVIGLSGRDGGRLRDKCDVCICVPAEGSYQIQEYHLPVYHTICLTLEEEFFGEND